MMTPERWQLIVEILEAALEFKREDALHLIEERCEVDDEMKAILLSLYESYRRRDSSFEMPAPEIVAEDMARCARQPLLKEKQYLEKERYEICGQLGEGGFAQVYKARDMKLGGRYVAVKIFSPSPENKSAEALRRFSDEVLAVSNLGHPNIVTVFDIGKHYIEEEDDTPFIVTEFIDGITLREYMQQQSRIEIPKALDIAIQVASALVPVHEKGLVHRDIKPENIMLGASDLVKIFDFGVAKFTRKEMFASESQELWREDTKSGAIIGSNKYMSPEQLRAARDVDERSDIWAVGVVLYEMIVGRVPFDGPTSHVISHRILSDEKPRPLSKYSSEVKPELDYLVLKALSKDRRKRYQKIEELFLDLHKLKIIYNKPERTGSFKATFLNLILWLSRVREVIFKSIASTLRKVRGQGRGGLGESPSSVEDSELTKLAEPGKTTPTSVVNVVPPRTSLLASALEMGKAHRKTLIPGTALLLLLIIGLTYLNSRRIGERPTNDNDPVPTHTVDLTSSSNAPISYPSPSGESTLDDSGSNSNSATRDSGPNPPEPTSLRTGANHLVLKRNLRGHRGAAWAVAISPNGQIAASGSKNNRVELWDTNSWKWKRLSSPLERPANIVTSLTFSRDGEMVAGSSKDKEVLLWRREDGYSQPQSLIGHSAAVNVVAFSPSEQLLASGGDDKSVILWDAQAARPQYRLEHTAEVLAVAFSPDGKTLASASKEGIIRIWDLRHPGESQVLCGECGEVYALAFSCNGKILVSGGGDNKIRQWDWARKEEPKTIGEHKNFVSSLAFTPDCKGLMSASGDGTIRLWDLKTGKAQVLKQHSKRVNSISFASNGMLISGSHDGTVKIWQLAAE